MDIWITVILADIAGAHPLLRDLPRGHTLMPVQLLLYTNASNKGIATSKKGNTTSSKKLLVAI